MGESIIGVSYSTGRQATPRRLAVLYDFDRGRRLMGSLSYDIKLKRRQKMTVKDSGCNGVERLKEGNRRYLQVKNEIGDISPAVRRDTCVNGQNPFALIITCSDSRVIPEAIFQVGIGDLFVIRIAGNVIDNHQLGSIEYAADHLGVKLIVVLGHTHCGAVEKKRSETPTILMKRAAAMSVIVLELLRRARLFAMMRKKACRYLAQYMILRQERFIF